MSDDLRHGERLAALETRMTRIEQDISSIAVGVTELKALANQGKGSLRTFLWLGGLIAGGIGMIASVVGFNVGITK